jgi:protein tyrosine phosphatase (PTP) superfamily phosphohydrolase (DUF442 family)
MDIVNFVKISDTLSTSGQPAESDFARMKALGYKTVINLALASSDNAIPTEGDIVTDLEMTYVQIPVQWQNPTIEQFALFAAVMQQQGANKVWVHCALNMRASAFIYLYRTLCLGEPKSLAAEDLHNVWKPKDIWSKFINDVELDPRYKH